jgi:hypothetical protein
MDVHRVFGAASGVIGVLAYLALTIATGVLKSWRVMWFALVAMVCWALSHVYEDRRRAGGCDRRCCPTRPDMPMCWCAMTLSVLTSLLAFFYVYQANRSNAPPMGWMTIWDVSSPCGKSSCVNCQTTGCRSGAYNPNGVFGQYDDRPLSHWFLYCPPASCRWGGNDDRAIRTYDNCSDLVTPCPTSAPTCSATTRNADYPNPGTGLLDQLLNTCAPLSPPHVGYCAGVPSMLLGHEGNPICSTCLGYWRRHGLFQGPDPTTTACPASNYTNVDDWFCWICPGSIPGEAYTASALSTTATLLVFAAFVIGVLALARLIVYYAPRARPSIAPRKRA